MSDAATMEDWLAGNPTAVEFARMFGDHTTAIAMLLNLARRASEMEEGEARRGFELAIEEASAWLDGDAADGSTNTQTLMEQVLGLLAGAYSLQTVKPGPLGVVI